MKNTRLIAGLVGAANASVLTSSQAVQGLRELLAPFRQITEKARKAYRTYLELLPNGPAAARVRELL